MFLRKTAIFRAFSALSKSDSYWSNLSIKLNENATASIMHKERVLNSELGHAMTLPSKSLAVLLLNEWEDKAHRNAAEMPIVKNHSKKDLYGQPGVAVQRRARSSNFCHCCHFTVSFLRHYMVTDLLTPVLFKMKVQNCETAKYRSSIGSTIFFRENMDLFCRPTLISFPKIALHL